MYNWPGHSLELGFGLGFGIEFSSRIQAECWETATTFLCYAAVCSVASRPLVSSIFAVLGVSFESQTKESKKIRVLIYSRVFFTFTVFNLRLLLFASQLSVARSPTLVPKPDFRPVEMS